MAACVSDYINSSDQTLSYVGIEGKVDEKGQILRMAGFIAQLMPEGDEKLFHELFNDQKKWDVFEESDREDSWQDS